MTIEDNIINLNPLGSRPKGKIGACPHKFCLWRPVQDKPGAWCKWHIQIWAKEVLALIEEEKKEADWKRLKGLDL